MEEYKEIPLNKIEVRENIRVYTAEKDLQELMSTIKQDGLQQPIGLTPRDNKVCQDNV